MGPFLKEHSTLICAIVGALFLRLFIVSVYKVPSDSMSPTFLAGDYIVASKASYGIRFPWSKSSVLASRPEKGDLVVVTFAERPTISYVRRVMALPGESVEVKGQMVTLAENEFFVLSDNTTSQDDSRFLGPVSLDHIESQAKLIWFSVGPESSIRWNRIFSLL